MGQNGGTPKILAKNLSEKIANSHCRVVIHQGEWSRATYRLLADQTVTVVLNAWANLAAFMLAECSSVYGLLFPFICIDFFVFFVTLFAYNADHLSPHFCCMRAAKPQVVVCLPVRIVDNFTLLVVVTSYFEFCREDHLATTFLLLLPPLPPPTQFCTVYYHQTN